MDVKISVTFSVNIRFYQMRPEKTVKNSKIEKKKVLLKLNNETQK